MTRRRAFTLVELLIVLGIIAALLGILLPALAKAREQARQAVCASNQRQIVLAMLMYANENKGILPMPLEGGHPPHLTYSVVSMTAPGQYSWTDGAIYRYLSSDPTGRQRLFNCPSDDADVRRPLDPSGLGPTPLFTRNFSYNFNPQLRGFQPGQTVRLPRIPGADHKILLLEEQMPGGTAGAVNVVTSGPQVETPSVLPELTTRHSGRANEAFADGHVELFDGSVFTGSLTPTLSIFNEAYYYYVDLSVAGHGPN